MYACTHKEYRNSISTSKKTLVVVGLLQKARDCGCDDAFYIASTRLRRWGIGVGKEHHRFGLVQLAVKKLREQSQHPPFSSIHRAAQLTQRCSRHVSIEGRASRVRICVNDMRGKPWYVRVAAGNLGWLCCTAWASEQACGLFMLPSP